MDNKIPQKPTEFEFFIVENWIVGIEVVYEQTGADTAQTCVILKCHGGKTAKWLDFQFSKVADLKLGYNRIAEPKYGLQKKVDEWKQYEKNNARELAEYERLKAKFEGKA